MFAYPLGLIALVGVPLVVGLHMFRRRFRPREVSAVFLWLDPDRSPAPGRKRERLRTSASLWLECAAAAALAVAFAGPRGCASGPARHFVAVLDDSASLSARGSDGRTSAQRARELLQARLDALPRDSRVTLVASSARPRVVAGPAALIAQARDALAEWRPSAPAHDIAPAIALAQQFAGDELVVFATDALNEAEIPAEIEVLASGEALANAGIVHATREIVALGEERVAIAVLNAASRPLTRTVSLSTEASDGSRLLTSRRLELAAQETRHVTLELPAGLPAVLVTLDEDAMTIDDRAVLAPPPRRTIGVAVHLAAETAQRLGLARADATASQRLAALLADAEPVDDAGDARLFVTEGQGSAIEGAVTLRLLTTGEASAPSAREETIGPFLRESAHPLLRGVTLEGLVWSHDPLLEATGEPLVRAGDAVLLAIERGVRGTQIALDLDPARSSLPRSPDWPILLANAAELARAALPGPTRTNLFAGEDLVVRTNAGETWRLADPEGNERRLGGRELLVFERLDRPGSWRLVDEAGSEHTIGISFADAAETDLSQRSSGLRPGSAAGSASLTSGSGGSWAWLVLAALALVAADWWVLAPRGRTSSAEA